MSTLKIVKVILSSYLTTPIWFYSTFQAPGALWLCDQVRARKEPS